MPTRAGEELTETVLGRCYLRMPDDVVAAVANDPSAAARWLLRRGAIVGVRGLGGFHIAADAANDATVRALREKKDRPAKPFAVMCRSLEVARALANVGPEEEKVLTSPWSPVVLLRKRADQTGRAAGSAARISELVAPQNAYLGVMLPYAPLHHLLFDDGLDALVMTSANRSGEPIVDTVDSARERLTGITRTFLTHDREIVNRNDDSVAFVESGRVMMSRRSRGYAPYPITLGRDTADVLACGTELKNTFTILKDGRAFVSTHIGDMENQATLDLYEEMIGKFLEWFRFTPALVAHDLHPDYLATRFAKDYASQRADSVRLVGVQHHHAHIASVMIENRETGPVIGIALDGTGYGTDGRIWGGEFLIADLTDFERAGHIKYVPLPGGDAAIRHPYRVALSHLHAAGVADLAGTARAMFGEYPGRRARSGRAADREERKLHGHVERGTSLRRRVGDPRGLSRDQLRGPGRDRARVAGGRRRRPGGDAAAYPYDILEENGAFLVDTSRTVLALVESVMRGDSRETAAARFHETVVAFCREVCGRLASARGIGKVGLSGGVFQNRYLLRRLSEVLDERRAYRAGQPGGPDERRRRVSGPGDRSERAGEGRIAFAEGGATCVWLYQAGSSRSTVTPPGSTSAGSRVRPTSRSCRRRPWTATCWSTPVSPYRC